MKTYLILFLSSLVFSIFILLGVVSYNPKTMDINCESVIERTAEGGLFKMKANYIFIFHKNGNGIITGDGDFFYKDKQYQLRRHAEISYQHVDGDVWKFTKLTEYKSAADNVPDEIYARNFYLTDESAGRFFTVKEFGAHVLIGSLRMSAFMCSKA